MSAQLPRHDLQHILDHTLPLWEDLRGERIFITGGSGFFGHWLLESFLYANEQLNLHARALLLTRGPDAFIAQSPHLALAAPVDLLAGDVRSFSFPPGVFSHVIHAATAASARLNGENPLLMLDTIITGTRRVLDFSLQCGAKRFLLTSSGAVYGRQPAGMTHIPEDFPGAPPLLEPGSAYGQGKRLAEHLCALYGLRPLEIKIARGFAFVGPRLPLDIHFAIGNFIRDGLDGGPIIVKGNGAPLRSYLYAADLAIWLWTILFRGQPLQPYNVGSENSLSIAALAHTTAACFEKKIDVIIQGTADPQKPVEGYVPDTTLARIGLGLQEWVNLQSGILRTIQWHRQI
jgi:dTDP-glucose 4,6-dehydratase